jgi:hypothetical protein
VIHDTIRVRVSEYLGRVRMPTLLLHHRDDRVLPLPCRERLSETIPGGGCCCRKDRPRLHFSATRRWWDLLRSTHLRGHRGPPPGERISQAGGWQPRRGGRAHSRSGPLPTYIIAHRRAAETTYFWGCGGGRRRLRSTHGTATNSRSQMRADRSARSPPEPGGLDRSAGTGSANLEAPGSNGSRGVGDFGCRADSRILRRWLCDRAWRSRWAPNGHLI